ncbi:hypothetical protein VPNG_03394 [Cytospora leucostoma]|uniref:Uncharacterized protein n=1 Tax=Cytospora leucostoma TaxID=1230097 RepID=A0A423XFQ1_9PEZI|nr:hypothetical protein VPNG_03394 [Cytospora leucostoma]
MVKRYRHISDLTPSDINLLARVLRLPPTARLPVDGSPSPQWLARQSQKISQLPKPLQRPHNWLERLSVYTNEKLNLTIEDLIPQCAVLCDAHKGLNPWVVHRVFLLLSEEVTRRLDPLRKYLKDPDRYVNNDDKVKFETAPAEVQDYVDRMNAILSLWTGPRVFARIVGSDYPPGMALPRVESHCEACIVACVGARAQALCDLRATMCGRSHRKREPVLLRLVEAWIENIGGADAERWLSESAVMASIVRRVRRAVMGKGAGHRHRYDQHGHHRRRHRTPYEKREKERVRMERDLDHQRLSASQRRAALGEIDGKLDEMFGWDSRKKDHDRHAINTVKPSRHGNESMSVDNYQQTHCGSWDNYSYIVDESRGPDGEDDTEPFPEYNENEFDEAEPDATYRLQDQVQSWYDQYTDIVGPADGSEVNNSFAHPAFRQTVAEMEDHFRSPQVAMSAVPAPLQVSKGISLWDEDDDDDWVPAAAAAARTELSQWTDVSVHTTTTQPTRKNGRGAGRPISEVPSVPRVPSMYRDDVAADVAVGHHHEDHASTNGGSVHQNVHGRGSSEAYGGGAFYPAPSSVYSNDDPAVPHPPPVATTVVGFPADAYYSLPPPPPPQNSDDIRPVEPAAAPSLFGGKFENPRTPPRVPRPQHRRGRPGSSMGIPDAEAASEITQWPGPGPYDMSAPPHSGGRQHRMTPSSSSSTPRRSMKKTPNSSNTPDTTLSSRGFLQAELDPEDPADRMTVLPEDSVSAVGRFYPPEEPGVVHRYRQKQRDQVDADEALARQLAQMDVHGLSRFGGSSSPASSYNFRSAGRNNSAFLNSPSLTHIWSKAIRTTWSFTAPSRSLLLDAFAILGYLCEKCVNSTLRALISLATPSASLMRVAPQLVVQRALVDEQRAVPADLGEHRRRAAVARVGDAQARRPGEDAGQRAVAVVHARRVDARDARLPRERRVGDEGRLLHLPLRPAPDLDQPEAVEAVVLDVGVLAQPVQHVDVRRDGQHGRPLLVGGGVAPRPDDAGGPQVVIRVQDIVRAGDAVHATQLAEGVLAAVEEVCAVAGNPDDGRGDVAVLGWEGGAGAERDDLGIAVGDVLFSVLDIGEEGRVGQFCPGLVCHSDYTLVHVGQWADGVHEWHYFLVLKYNAWC